MSQEECTQKIEEIRADRLDSGGTTIAIEKLAGKSMPWSGVVDKLYREIAAILRMPDVRGQLEGMGLEIVASSPSEFSAYIDSESKKWGKLIKDAKVTVDSVCTPIAGDSNRPDDGIRPRLRTRNEAVTGTRLQYSS